MAYRYAFASSLAAAAIMLAGAPDAATAQCRLCSKPVTELMESDGSDRIQIEVATILDFDRLVLLGGGGGAATLLPNGERSASGSIATLSAKAMVGSVTVRGEPGRILRIEMPRRIDLHSIAGGSIAIDDIETDLSGLPKLDSAGNLSFQFGGRLTILGDADGEYRGDVPITVDYL